MSLAAFCGSPLAPTQDLCTKRHFAPASVQHDVSVYLESICLTLSQVCIQFRMIRVGVAGVSATPYSCKWDLTSFARTSHSPMLHKARQSRSTSSSRSSSSCDHDYQNKKSKYPSPPATTTTTPKLHRVESMASRASYHQNPDMSPDSVMPCTRSLSNSQQCPLQHTSKKASAKPS